MELNKGEAMSSKEENQNHLLVEYSKILVRHLSEGTKFSDEETSRLNEIQVLLGLDHDSIMKMASQYLEGTVGGSSM